MPAALDGYVRGRVAGTAAGGYLFPSSTGEVWTNTNLRARSGGMDATREAGGAGPAIHALLHTAASLLIAAGADVKAEVILGHSTATMTMERLPAIPLIAATRLIEPSPGPSPSNANS